MVGGRSVEFTQPGSVTRITMKNFMTYKHETVYPGPNFNVTVGPNGSGKSSIVTALSIALGGELSSLNRQLELKSLINTEAGNNPAEIEIELFNKDGANTVVKARLSKDSPQPNWWINNKVATHNQLLELTAKLQIQPGNLCQFLPQDVVREFPQMKPHTIFENTIKALGDLEMLSKLKRGEEIQQKLDVKEEELKTKQNTLASYEQKEKRHEHDRKMLEERNMLLERKATLDAAIKWAKFKVIRKKTLDMRKERDKLNLEQIEVGEKLKPIKEFLEEFDRSKEALKEGLEKTEHEVQEKGRFVQEFEITELEDELDRQVEKEKDITQDENNRIQKKERLMQEIKDLKEKKLTCQFTSHQEEELRRLKKDKNNRDLQIISKEATIVELEQHIKGAKNELNNLQLQKNNLNSAKARKLAVLEKENQDAYRGVLWLRENQDKFKSRVHEPIMLCLNLVKSEYARYVETHVGRADLEGFVCEDPDDLNLLLRVLREEKGFRRISAFHSSHKERNSFIKPLSEDELRKYGFQSYLSDMYEAPPAVNAFLCQQKNLHQVPLFEKDTPSTDELSKLFRSYYVGNSKYTVKQSKYSGEFSKGEEDIGNRRVIRLKDSVDKSRLEEVEAEMEKKTAVRRNHETRLKQQNDTINKIKDDINQLQEKCKVLDGKRREAVTIDRELELKQNVVETLVEPKVNIEAEKREIHKAKNKLVLDLCKTTLALKENVEACGLLDLKKQCKLLQIMNVESENREQTDARKQLEERDSSIRAQLQDVNKTFAEHSNELQESHKKAKEATNGCHEEQKSKAPPEWIERFKELGESYNDITILDVMLEEVDTDLKTKFKKFDTELEKKINENNNKLRDARESVDKLNKDIRDKTKELEELRRGWIHGVRRMVGRVGDKFANMMATLGYAGQIELHEGSNNNLDMKSYGIRISVKFRNDDTFQELSKGTQSGGEKSVTTAVYMMALQGLTQVPFRCVDEINQGMDERNERQVWDMLLEVCREHQAQYFYMAPKFPYSLPFDNQVTILICNKGNLDKNSHHSFSTQSFVQASRRSN